MQFETWWLIVVPIVFSLGWVAARLESKSSQAEQNIVPASYFKGVNFLLNEQPDKAIDAFLEVAALDTTTVELHFALASLFRKKGEIDRAIRVHQFLAQREQVSQIDREKATFELGVDFLKAGILDRAEQALKSLEQSSIKSQAASQLLELYELEKDWHKAIHQATVLGQLGAEVPVSSISHFYCELAMQAIAQSQYQIAKEYLNTALKVNELSVRATLLLGEVSYQAGQYKQALDYWDQAENLNPWYLPLIGQKVWNAYVEINQQETGLQQLKQYCKKYPSIDLLLILVDATEQEHDQEAAFLLLRNEVQSRPSLLALDSLLERQLKNDLVADKQEDFQLIRELITRFTQRLERYRCQTCGFQAKQFYWQCPGCASWDSIVPRRAEELDFYPLNTKKTMA